MKILVACAACSRQYEVTGRTPGSTFHCACGEALVVRQPTGRDATVVRCASCGGPRAEGASSSCRWCGAAFGLGERDLATVCPQCFARMGDAARFCPSCGVEIRAETLAPEASDRPCPVCRDVLLVGRSFGEAGRPALECPGCAGLWVGADTFRRLEDEATRAVSSLEAAAGAPAPARSAVLTREQKGPVYRQCVECGTRMNRVNYGRRSGFILDVCREHGVWCDADELDGVLAWVRAGGAEKARELERESRRREQSTRPRTGSMPALQPDLESGSGAAGLDLVRLLGRLFNLLV